MGTVISLVPSILSPTSFTPLFFPRYRCGVLDLYTVYGFCVENPSLPYEYMSLPYFVPIGTKSLLSEYSCEDIWYFFTLTGLPIIPGITKSM